MEKCEICDWPATLRVFARPRKGGPRTAHRFCCEECKASGLKVLSVQGHEETHAVLGWDVFVPMWEKD